MDLMEAMFQPEAEAGKRVTVRQFTDISRST
jgi:hypothetical protein